MTDHVCEQKIRVSSFIAEHDLFFTLAQPLVSLCKKLAEDKNTLTKLSVSNQHASYLSTHDVAPEFKQRLSKKPPKNMFSMNIDEATNVSMDKKLNGLVRYYDEELVPTPCNQRATSRTLICPPFLELHLNVTQHIVQCCKTFGLTKDDLHAYCALCRCDVDVSTQGKGAIESYSKSYFNMFLYFLILVFNMARNYAYTRQNFSDVYAASILSTNVKELLRNTGEALSLYNSEGS
ncbi:hypothetical protein ABVT39_001232 [Epinephelus coioides]